MAAGGNHYVDYLLEQFASLRNVSRKRFFGGVALVYDGTQFAMVMGNELYFVVDEATRANYERMGGSCFSYATKKGRVAVQKYYTVPAALIDDEGQLVALARESIRVASSLKSPATRRAKTALNNSSKRKSASLAVSKKRSGAKPP